jgi:YHS domain-containing protein
MFAFLGRILLFFIAVSIIRSVVAAVLRILGAARGQGGGVTPRPTPTQATTAAGGAPGSTLLHQDPVCGTYVAAASSLRKISKGQVYHFCSEECRDRFQA